ncbi:hypothetical protein [Saccharopolyspora shandongensis]|uniref:hypothetical protein n=1 Tax=Saccharopolyspora shandongensis TaxID=418495 RepID=UPI003403D736
MAGDDLVVTEDTMQKDPGETPDAIKGIGLAESGYDLYQGISEGSWVAAGLGAAGLAMEAVSMAVDPIGTLISYGLSWLIEHVHLQQPGLQPRRRIQPPYFDDSGRQIAVELPPRRRQFELAGRPQLPPGSDEQLHAGRWAEQRLVSQRRLAQPLQPVAERRPDDVLRRPQQLPQRRFQPRLQRLARRFQP